MSFTVRRIREERPPRKWPLKPVFIALIGIGGSLLQLFSREKERLDEKHAANARAMLLKKFLLVLIAVLCALLLIAGTVKALTGVQLLSLQTVTKLAGTPPPSDANGFTNLLLLGQGDAGHDGVNLTDTIMVASFDPKDTKSVVLLSIPRDTYLLSTEKMGAGRVNTMYRDYSSFLRFQQGMDEEAATQEAMKELAAEIGRKVGLEIHHTVKVDFDGFVRAVDVIEGIDVTVPETIVDTEYPNENYGYETFRLEAGLQHLDGATALKYARSRHSTSDFDRSARQQQILQAMGDKAREMGIASNPQRIIELLNILSENMATTMSLGELVGMADIAQEIDRSKIVTMQLNDRNGLYGGFVDPGGFLYTPPRDQFGGASVLLPVSIPEFPVTWKQITSLGELLFRQRDLYLANTRFAILNSDARSGSAGLLASELFRYGFDVPIIENAPGEKRAASFLAPLTEAEIPLAEAFSALLDIPLGPLPEGLTEDLRAPIVIVLGADYRYSPLQDLVPAAQ
jgi:LCP family protein required for cell wall assembly